MPSDETPRQPESLHSETFPAPAAPPQHRRAFGAGECGDAIWECEAADGELRENDAVDPHAPDAQQHRPETGGQGWRIIDLDRRVRRE
jgi:hypothetical protein